MLPQTIMIIPARGGSKGVPQKNIKALNGKPLVAHIIEAGRKAYNISRVFVSTDSKKIAQIAKQYQADVIDRPANLSGDCCSSESALLHALNEIDKPDVELPEIFVFAQCTSPMTAAEDLDNAIKIFLDNDYDCLFSCTSFNGFIWSNNNKRGLRGVNFDHKKQRVRRQDLKPQYRETGAFYILKTKLFREQKNRFFGKVGMFVMPKDKSIDIDTLNDFKIAETLLKNKPD